MESPAAKARREECELCITRLKDMGLIDSGKTKQEILSASYYPTLITNFRRWSLKNHPDKGGDAELFKFVSNCVTTITKTSQCNPPILPPSSSSGGFPFGSGFSFESGGEDAPEENPNQYKGQYKKGRDNDWWQSKFCPIHNTYEWTPSDPPSSTPPPPPPTPDSYAPALDPNQYKNQYKKGRDNDWWQSKYCSFHNTYEWEQSDPPPMPSPPPPIPRALPKKKATPEKPRKAPAKKTKNQLDKMTVPELKAYARDIEMSGYSSLRKDELVKEIMQFNKTKASAEVCTKTVPELKAEAKAKGITGYSKLNKKELCEMLGYKL